MNLLFSNKVSKAFADKVIDIADKLPASEPSWLMFTMGFETGWTFSPSIQNPNSSATGLLQFLESTAQWLGTSTEELKKMSAEKQLDYVYLYLRRIQEVHGRFSSYYDVYFSVLYPIAIGKSDDYQLDAKSSLSNLGFDLNKDKIVTVGEIKKALDAKVYEKVPTEYYDSFFKKKTSFNCINMKLSLVA